MARPRASRARHQKGGAPRACHARALRCAALLIAASLVASFASAQGEKRVLIDGELQARTIKLLSLSGDTVVYEDEQGRRRQATVGGFVALLPAPPPYGGAPFVELPGYVQPPNPASSNPGLPAPGAPVAPGTQAPPPRGSLDLVDGQRFPGEQAATGGDKDAVVWNHPKFGPITLPLDRVAKVLLDSGMRKHPLQSPGADQNIPATASARQDKNAPRTKDEITLVNGDTLVGFLLSLGNPIEIEVDGATVTLAPERVASARLASKAEPLRGMVVWLADGSVAVVASIESKGDAVSIRLPGGQAADFPLEDVRAVAFDAGRLRPLASIAPSDEHPIGRRVLLDPVRTLEADAASGNANPDDLNAPDIEFPGPMTATWKLPAGSRRFATVAELPLDALPWGDCEIIISVDGMERIRERLSQDGPRKEISLTLASASAAPGGGAATGSASAAREITISIDPGAYGPINDRVILRRPLLLVQ